MYKPHQLRLVVYPIPLFIGFHTSQVVQDFSHQQYLSHEVRPRKEGEQPQPDPERGQ